MNKFFVILAALVLGVFTAAFVVADETPTTPPPATTPAVTATATTPPASTTPAVTAPTPPASPAPTLAPPTSEAPVQAVLSKAEADRIAADRAAEQERARRAARTWGQCLQENGRAAWNGTKWTAAQVGRGAGNVDGFLGAAIAVPPAAVGAAGFASAEYCKTAAESIK